MPLHLLQIAKKLAHDAGRMALTYQKKGFRIEKKGAHDLVTDADRACEKLIIDTIKRNFPEHQILSEEAGALDGNSDYKWIIDPIDGTTNFANGIPYFSIAIAVIYKGKPIIGVVEIPGLRETFWAKEGEGAFLNDKRIYVSKESELNEALFSTGFPYDRSGPRYDMQVKLYEAFHKPSHGIRRFGSAAADLCFVAAGRFSGYWEYNLKPWDIAAGKIILEEAGGVVTNMDGTTLTPKKGQLLASNGLIRNTMINIIKEHGGDKL